MNAARGMSERVRESEEGRLHGCSDGSFSRTSAHGMDNKSSDFTMGGDGSPPAYQCSHDDGTSCSTASSAARSTASSSSRGVMNVLDLHSTIFQPMAWIIIFIYMYTYIHTTYSRLRDSSLNYKGTTTKHVPAKLYYTRRNLS